MGYRHGSTVVSSSTTFQLTATSTQAMETLIKAWPANTGIVYLGNSGVTAGTDPAADGIPLSADESITIPRRMFDDPSDIYLIASTTSNQVSWGVIT